MKLDKPRIINLPKIIDKRGNLSIIEEQNNIPFDIKRTYWIYDVAGGKIRDGCSYKKNKEFIVALSGSFDVLLDNGIEVETFSLNQAYYGLFVPSGVWRQMLNFSTNSLALVLASTHFDLSDYIYDYDLFKNQNK